VSFSSALSFQRRETKRRLVEQEEAGAAHQRACNRQHLLLTARERAAALFDALLEAGKQCKHAFEIRSKMCGAGNGGAHLQVFQHGHAHEDAPAFRRLRDFQPRDLVRRKLRDVAAGEDDLAFAGARVAEDRHHQRRLAGAVGPDQRHDLTLADVDINALERGDMAVIGLHRAHGEEGRRHRTLR
jgi:hypothetical protein